MNTLQNPMTQNPFKKEIFEVLRKSYAECQIFNLSFDENVTKMTEYYITVSLSKELLNWNEENKYPFKIELEKNTTRLFHDCFENYKQIGDKWNPGTFASHSNEFKESHDAIRKGKVDIALSRTHNSRNISEYIFEVKAVNPDIGELKKDFQRIQQFLNAEVPDFENSFKGGFLVFLKHHNKNKIQNRESLIESQTTYINNLKSQLDEIKAAGTKFSIDCKTITLSDGESLQLQNGYEHGEEAYKTFFAYGVIIAIQK
ncbi:hypothetical protein AAEO57_09950 [Flavobacterium sp. DGU38]|uniref:Eco47II restriction endonuclease n=1 Tax=Flavobacterium calami TaxID=3139144 RepID=A0ABU9INS6_9FLAO